MRVAYVGNFRPSFSTENELRRALEALNVEVIQLQEDQLDFRTLAARADDVDFVLWTRTWVLDHDAQWQAVHDLRAAGVPLVAYHLDRYVGLNREHQLRDEPFFHGDVMISADGGHEAEFAAAGVEHVWFPPGVSEFECEPGQWRRDYASDVAFVGSWRKYHAEWPWRQDLVLWLRRNYRGRMKLWPKLGQPPVREQALRDLYASTKVVVGDSCLAGGSTNYWSDRIPETLGRGGFLVHPHVDGIDEWFTDREHLAFVPPQDFDALRATIDYYLEHDDERAKIAAAGREHVLAHHTYTVRMRALLDLLRERGLVAGDFGVAKLNRWRGRFEPRPDVATDAEVVAEVWASNDYRVPLQGLSGTVVDVGANIGAFTVLAAKAGAENVFAYEPEPENRARLVVHVRANNVEHLVMIHDEAITGDGGDGHISGSGGGARLDSEGEPVPSITLTELIERHKPIALLKVDIEGGEFAAFESVSASLLHEHVEAIAMEWHGPAMPHLAGVLRGDEFGALITKLADCGHVETHGHPTRGGLLFWRRY